MSQRGLINERQFFDGFALVQSLPGPLFNLSSFLGACADGLRGAFIGWVFMFLPGILVVIAALPFWNKFRSNPIFQKAIEGVNAIGVGMILSGFLLMWNLSVKEDVFLGCIAFLSGVALYYDVTSPLLIVSGGVAALIREFLLLLLKKI